MKISSSVVKCVGNETTQAPPKRGLRRESRVAKEGLEPIAVTVGDGRDFGNPAGSSAAKSGAVPDALPVYLRAAADMLLALADDDRRFVGMLLALPDANRRTLAALLAEGG